MSKRATTSGGGAGRLRAASARGKKTLWRKAPAARAKRAYWGSGWDKGLGLAIFDLESGRRLAGANLLKATLIRLCRSDNPSKKEFLRLWAKGARFDHQPRLMEGLMGRWPGMFLSSVGGRGCQLEGRDKGWLWGAMAREGADLAQVNEDGLGFEALAARAGDRAALRWWRGQGMGIDRKTKAGRSVWSLAFEREPLAAGLMAELWPEAEGGEEPSEALYGLMGLAAKEGIETRMTSGGAHSFVIQTGKRALSEPMASWGTVLSARPEWVRPSHELSEFMRECGASEASTMEVKALERAAMAWAERAELGESSGSGAAKSSLKAAL